MRIADALFCALLAAAGTARAAPYGPVLGDWVPPSGDGVVRIEPCGTALCGVVVGTSLTGKDSHGGELLDVHGRPQCHLAIITGLVPQDDGRLHGTVTDPTDGRSYGAELWVPADGDLRLRGYVAVPLLGVTQRWHAFHGRVAEDCREMPAPR